MKDEGDDDDEEEGSVAVVGKVEKDLKLDISDRKAKKVRLRAPQQQCRQQRKKRIKERATIANRHYLASERQTMTL
ncbi:Hypothetical predicted protein [Olea europaea subsp. europaea]|uniref:Uncharacterized protein n=1 Tax=Olea europaea subsp. europaea TaxID=158383 RepID=A0A8S0R892_OLEEU|nr:Hypothetical predicted protein [Olea europaea subsp. europaea]